MNTIEELLAHLKTIDSDEAACVLEDEISRAYAAGWDQARAKQYTVGFNWPDETPGYRTVTWSPKDGDLSTDLEEGFTFYIEEE